MVYIEPVLEEESVRIDSSTINLDVPKPFQQHRPAEKVQEFLQATLKNTINNTKKVFGRLKLSINLVPSHHKKAKHYINKCWNHMARNEVEKAKQCYEKLRELYEAMPEGSLKTTTYYEVLDIYQRLSEVKH